MNITNITLRSWGWLGEDGAKSKLAHVVHFNQYQETEKIYKVDAHLVLRLIRNELKVLSQHEHKVLWHVTKIADNTFRVKYACIKKELLKPLNFGFRLIVPQGWLLSYSLEQGQLYQLQDKDAGYWLWLTQHRKLIITKAVGLMQSSRYFVDALGLPASSALNPIQINMRQVLSGSGLTLSVFSLLGLLVYHVNPHKKLNLDFRKLIGVTIGVCLTYMLLFSAFIKWQQNSLEKQVIALRQTSEQILNVQSKIQDKTELLEAYNSLHQRYASTTDVLGMLATHLPDSSELSSLTVSGRLVQLSGAGPSATAVLAALAESGKFDEIRFSQNVRVQRGQEHYTISLVMPEFKEQQSE